MTVGMRILLNVKTGGLSNSDHERLEFVIHRKEEKQSKENELPERLLQIS